MVFFDITGQHETAENELGKNSEEKQNAIAVDPPVITKPRYCANDLHRDAMIVNTVNQDITYTYRARFQSRMTKFQTRSDGPTN